MEIEKEIKKNIIEQKLLNYKKKYYELELNKIALEAINDKKGLQIVIQQMQALEKAYNAILNIKL